MVYRWCTDRLIDKIVHVAFNFQARAPHAYAQNRAPPDSVTLASSCNRSIRLASSTNLGDLISAHIEAHRFSFSAHLGVSRMAGTSVTR